MELEVRKYLIPPTPVVLVSTLYGEVKNVAPFGMFMPVSSNPPMVALGIRQIRDTFKNIQPVLVRGHGGVRDRPAGSGAGREDRDHR